MPNKVLYNGEEYFVMDVYYYGKNKMKYKLDDGRWVESEKVEIVDQLIRIWRRQKYRRLYFLPRRNLMFKLANPNPRNHEIDDCVVRAIAIATGHSWDYIQY